MENYNIIVECNNDFNYATDKVKESSVAYGESPFEKEFARRTIANLEFIESEVEKRHGQGIEDKDINDVFEVTQLINSFVGLLVFPKEAFFSNLQNNDVFKTGEANQILSNLSSDRDRYYSSYCNLNYANEPVPERLTPKSLARHFRNAIAHNRLTILPKEFTKDGVIEGVEFSDRNEHGESFRLQLSVYEIRVLLLSISELILRAA